jgi:hypothetical protein
VNFARQYGLEIEKVLDSIIVSRPFTIHQLAGLIINELEQSTAIVQRFGAKLVVISDLLKMFIQDPQQIDTDEARWLVKEIVKALLRLANHVLVVISLHKLPSQFCDLILPLFDICIDIDATATATAATICSQQKTLQMKIISNRRHGGDSTSCGKVSLTEKDLQIVPVR